MSTMSVPVSKASSDMAVADCLLDDIESIETITKLLNVPEFGWRELWPSDFTQIDVEASILRLANRKFIEVLVYDRAKRHLVATSKLPVELNSPEVWFALTKRGSAALKEWKREHGLR